MTATPAGQPEQDKQIVRIWDDPESRINFLETVLKKKEWEAVIYHPDFAPDGTQRAGNNTPLPELNAKLTAQGYKTILGQDENGIPTLTVRNFGSDTKLTDTIRELGFTKGMTHKITHLGEPLGNAMQKTADMVKHVASDKARLIGGLYMIGDLILIFAGLGNKKGQEAGASEGFASALKDPANMLQSAAGVAATIQSLIYMGFAKEGSEAMYSDLMKRAKEANAQGKDLLDASVWENARDTGAPKGLLGLPHKVLKSYPIQLGALTQVVGQLGLMASGGIRLKRSKHDTSADAGSMRRGAMQDMLTATTSVIGWSLLTKTKPEKIADEDKLPWGNPKRVWQEMSEKPNQFASGFLSAATLSGIAAGRAKGNNIQTMGNLTYLLGDGIMFMTNSDDYGAAARGNSGLLAEAAERFVKASPVILGAKEQAQFVGQLADHLAERSLHEEAKKQKRSAPVTDAEVKDLSQRIAAGLNAKLPKVNDRTNEAAARIAGIVQNFHPVVGEQITDALCATISKMDGVAIDKDELKTHVVRQTEYAKDKPAQLVKMDDIAKPMADLLFAVPGAATPEAVNKLYDAVDEYIRPEPVKGMQPLEQAINQTAVQDIAAVSQAQQHAANPPVGSHTAALAAARQQQAQGAPLSR
jgi:hypothetical protein